MLVHRYRHSLLMFIGNLLNCDTLLIVQSVSRRKWDGNQRWRSNPVLPERRVAPLSETWDSSAGKSLTGLWLDITLKSGDVYAGYLCYRCWP